MVAIGELVIMVLVLLGVALAVAYATAYLLSAPRRAKADTIKDELQRYAAEHPDRNAAHDLMYPDCNRPLPHGHEMSRFEAP